MIIAQLPQREGDQRALPNRVGIVFHHVWLKHAIPPHDLPENIPDDYRKDTRNLRRATDCNLFALADSFGNPEAGDDAYTPPQLLVSTRVKCFFKDQMTRDIARRQALSRALALWVPGVKEHLDQVNQAARPERIVLTRDRLHTYNFNKAVRTAVWAAYDKSQHDARELSLLLKQTVDTATKVDTPKEG